jgi:8-oxo-dGTP diphosphatase
MNNVIFPHPPPDFHPTVEVAGCFCIWESKILYLKRHPGKPQGNKWGLPAGKREKGEDPRTCAAREVYEEAGIRINPAELEEVARHYIRFQDIDYIFYTFKKSFKTVPPLTLGTVEHVEAKWLSIAEVLALPLMFGGKEAIEAYLKISSSS